LGEARRSRRRSNNATTDPIQYLIVWVPSLSAVGDLLTAMARLVQSETLRILDCVVLSKDDLGALRVLDLDDIEDLPPDAVMHRENHGLLTDHDIELASFSLAPGTAGIVVVSEDRWAAPLSTAAANAGGRIAAGELIPGQRVGAALREPSHDLLARPPVGSTEDETGWADMIIDPVEQLKMLAQLHADGALSDEEFARQKAKIVGS
jgi:hypothetical protein